MFVHLLSFFAKKKGHIARVCKAKREAREPASGTPGQSKVKNRMLKNLTSDATVESEVRQKYWCIGKKERDGQISRREISSNGKWGGNNG